MTPAFHLALHVHDLAAARGFYGDILGCAEGRSAESWVDFDFFGHQLSLHQGEPLGTCDTGQVDGKPVPMPHFGAILSLKAWQHAADRLKAAGIDFIVEPQTRFAGQPGEQSTMFFRDPSGNAIELKAIHAQ